METILLDSAKNARKYAYAPYSGYLVGAAVLDESGNIWTGCNVENVSYGLCVCAERTAVCKMISEGHREVRAIAVATRDGGTPCGMCLQTLLEFAPDTRNVEVSTISDSGQINRFFLSELIPHGFNSNELRRT
jgi:cytidine deaminase